MVPRSILILITVLPHELHKAGVDVPEGILTTEELVNALCQ